MIEMKHTKRGLRQRVISMILSIAGIIVVLYVALTLIMFLFQRYFIYFPTRGMVGNPASVGLGYDDVRFETSDGVTLSGWFVPNNSSDKVALFFHGNAGNISHRLESIATLHGLGLNVFIIDYRGYGQSEGRISEAGTYLDAEAAWHYLVEDRGFQPAQIVIFGRSLGGGVATWLALNYPPKALILESTFTSIPNIGADKFPFLPVKPLARLHYTTIERLPQITVPLFMAHSPDDEVIPYSHGQQLFAVAQEPKTFFKMRGGHNEGFRISPNYKTELAAFIARYVEERD